MSAASDYLEDAFLDHVLGTAALASPAAVYVKLHIGAPGEAGTANPAANTTRKAVTFGAASGGTATNTSAASWTSVSADETYSHFSYWDALTGGNCLLLGTMTAPVSVLTGNDFEFPVGSLTATAA